MRSDDEKDKQKGHPTLTPINAQQTSGTSNLAERAITKETTPGPVHEWSDKEDVFEFEERKEAEEAYGQRTTDVAVVKTGERTGVKTYIMMPPTIYGRGTGFFNQGSMQIPSVIRAAVKSGVPAYVGDGTARLGHVHVTDLALLYELVFGKVLAGEEIPSGRRGIYFSNTGSHNWRDIAGHVGRAGVALGALKAAEPRSVSLDEVAAKWLKAPPQVAEMNYAAKYVSLTPLSLIECDSMCRWMMVPRTDKTQLCHHARSRNRARLEAQEDGKGLGGVVPRGIPDGAGRAKVVLSSLKHESLFKREKSISLNL